MEGRREGPMEKGSSSPRTGDLPAGGFGDGVRGEEEEEGEGDSLRGREVGKDAACKGGVDGGGRRDGRGGTELEEKDKKVRGRGGG